MKQKQCSILNQYRGLASISQINLENNVWQKRSLLDDTCSMTQYHTTQAKFKTIQHNTIQWVYVTKIMKNMYKKSTHCKSNYL